MLSTAARPFSRVERSSQKVRSLDLVSEDFSSFMVITQDDGPKIKHRLMECKAHVADYKVEFTCINVEQNVKVLTLTKMERLSLQGLGIKNKPGIDTSTSSPCLHDEYSYLALLKTLAPSSKLHCGRIVMATKERYLTLLWSTVLAQTFYMHATE